MTKAQALVLDRLRKLGAAFVGDGIPKDTQKYDLAGYIKLTTQFYGKKEGERARRLLKKYGVTDDAVWCSKQTFTRLQELNLIEPIDELSGVWRVTDSSWQTGKDVK